MLSTRPVTDKIIAPLEADVFFPSAVTGDVIILLGGGVYDAVPDLTGTGAPKEDMLARIVNAVRLQRQLKLPIIVSGGAPQDFVTPEAKVVARFLHDLGVPADRIIMEDKSTDTLENAQNVAVICKQQKFSKPVLVTSAYHVKRSLLAFRKVGITVVPVPANFRNSANKEYTWAAFLPTADTLETAWRALREYIALTYYHVFLSL